MQVAAFILVTFASLAIVAYTWFAFDAEEFPILNGGEEMAAKRAASYRKARSKCFYALIFLPILFFPTIDDIWRVRIGLIKIQLASPENIQKGADVIERIGQKLECKYLGCDEKKKD